MNEPALPEPDARALPGEDELPYDDGLPLESQQHKRQMDLLIYTLSDWWCDRDDIHVGGNMFIYFSEKQVKTNDFRGPDVFVVTGTTRRSRKSWVVWQEERAPDIVIELTSPSTWRVDHTRKKEAYARALRVPYYFIFNPDDAQMSAFLLEPGASQYRPMLAGEDGRFSCAETHLQLGLWEGVFDGHHAVWLRWFDAGGALIPTANERADAESRRAEEESRRAEEESRRAGKEAAARAIAEARIAELEARLAALSADTGDSSR